MSTHLHRNDDFVLQKEGAFSILISTIFKRKKAVELQMNSEEAELIRCLNNAREEWITACIEFEYADDQEIIDYHTYKIKAYQLKYEYYLKKAKEKGIRVNLLTLPDNHNIPAGIQHLNI